MFWKLFYRSALLTLIAGAAFLVADAQTNGADTNIMPPFAAGEELHYEGKLYKLILRGFSVADLDFKVEENSDEKTFLIKGEARSNGTLPKLINFSFLQQVDSTIAKNEFHALKTVKHDVQKSRIRDSEAVFNYDESRVTYTETNPKEPMKPPHTIASVLAGKTHDIVSAIFTLRMLPLAVGKTFEISVSDSGLVYKVPIRVTARERQKSLFGKVWCFRIEPEVFGPGRLIESDGSMVIWITDDQSRIPVRSQVKTTLGRIEIKLKKFKKSNPAKS